MDKSVDSDRSNDELNNKRSEIDLRNEIDRLNAALAASQDEKNRSAAYGLDLLHKTEILGKKLEETEALYEQSKNDLQELREAWNKAVTEQRVSSETVFEKEAQLIHDNDALTASFSIVQQQMEKEIKSTKSLLDSAIAERERYLSEKDELSKKVSELEQERKSLKNELKDFKSRETKLLNENSELEDDNVNLQKQVSNLRSTQVEFESSKHEIHRLQVEVANLNGQLEEMLTLKRITERHMQEALEGLESEREQKHALRKELDKRNSAEPLVNWTSIAALKGSPHLANLALRGLNSSHRSSGIHDLEVDGSPNGYNDHNPATTFSDNEHSFDIIHDLEMPSIEGSLFDEVHSTELKKLQANLEEKENQRSNLNTRLIEIQHKLESKSRQAEEIERKLTTICTLIEETYKESEFQKTPVKSRSQEGEQKPLELEGQINEVTSTTNRTDDGRQTTTSGSLKANVLDDFDNIYSHLQTFFGDYQELRSNASKLSSNPPVAVAGGVANEASQPRPPLESSASDDKTNISELLKSDDMQSLRDIIYKKNEQLKTLRSVMNTNKESADVALENLKAKYRMQYEIANETMTNLKLELKTLNEDAATFASLRSQFSARIEEYNTELEKVQAKLAASEHEKNTVNSILRLAIEQKIMLTQKLEALEIDREDPQVANKGTNSQQSRTGAMRGRGSAGRSTRGSRTPRSTGFADRR